MTPTEADINRLEKAAWDAGVDGVLVWYRDQRDLLRSALVKVVGVDGRSELGQMEAAMRLIPAPAEDKAATIDAIHALLATCEEPQAADAVDPQVVIREI